MNLKKLGMIFMTVMMVFTMSFSIVNASEVDMFEVEDGWETVEFTVNEDGSITEVQPRNSSFSQTVTVYSEWFEGEAWTATNTQLTVSGRASNTGSTVSIYLAKKGILNRYYQVSGSSVTLACDGQTHNLYNGFDIDAGSTYRFYYKANGGTTHSPSVTLGVVLWD